MSFPCNQITLDGTPCTHRVSVPNGPCAAAKHHRQHDVEVCAPAALDMRVAYPAFDWDKYTPEETAHLEHWLQENTKNNRNLIEEVAEEPYGRLNLVLKHGSHLPRVERTTRAQTVKAMQHQAALTAAKIASFYQVKHTDNKLLGPVTLIYREGQRAIKLSLTEYKDGDGKRRVHHVGAWGAALAFVESNPDVRWTPRLLAAMFGQIGGNTKIKDPEARARGILLDLANQGLIVKEDWYFKPLGADRVAVLGSERVLPQTAGGILAATYEDEPTPQGPQMTTAEMARVLQQGGFIQQNPSSTMGDHLRLAKSALERLAKRCRGLQYDRMSDTWTLSPKTVAHMPSISVG